MNSPIYQYHIDYQRVAYLIANPNLKLVEPADNLDKPWDDDVLKGVRT
jgi:hypothetical protein